MVVLLYAAACIQQVVLLRKRDTLDLPFV